VSWLWDGPDVEGRGTEPNSLQYQKYGDNQPPQNSGKFNVADDGFFPSHQYQQQPCTTAILTGQDQLTLPAESPLSPHETYYKTKFLNDFGLYSTVVVQIFLLICH